MDGIISEHSRKALEAVSPAFRALQAQIRVVEDIKPGMNGGQMRVAEALREPRARAFKKLFEAQEAFTDATHELKAQIISEVTREIQNIVSTQTGPKSKALTSKNLADALSDTAKQDIRTFLVLGTIKQLIDVSLGQSVYDLPHGVNSNAELFHEMFLEALQPTDVTRQTILARQQRSWAAPTFTLERAFVLTSSELQGAINEQLQAHGWNQQPGSGHRFKTVAGMVVGGVAGTATAIGLTDGSWVAPVLGLLGGSIMGGGAAAIGESIHMGALPKQMITRVGGAELAGVSMEAQPLMAIHREVNPEYTAKMLAEALKRAASQDKGRDGGGGS